MLGQAKFATFMSGAVPCQYGKHGFHDWLVYWHARLKDNLHDDFVAFVRGVTSSHFQDGAIETIFEQWYAAIGNKVAFFFGTEGFLQRVRRLNDGFLQFIQSNNWTQAHSRTLLSATKMFKHVNTQIAPSLWISINNGTFKGGANV